MSAISLPSTMPNAARPACSRRHHFISVGPDVGAADHASDALVVVAYICGELLGGVAARIEHQLVEPPEKLGRLDRAHHLAVQARDDLRRGAGGHEGAEPAGHFESG